MAFDIAVQMRYVLVLATLVVLCATAAEGSCSVCVRTAAELEQAVEFLSSGRRATVNLCASTASEPLQLDRSIDVAGFGLAADLTIACCAEETKCRITRTDPAASFSFAASTGGVAFTLENIEFTQDASAGSPMVPLVGTAEAIVPDPMILFIDCHFEGISGSLLPGAVDEDFGAVLNLPFVLTSQSDGYLFESVRSKYVENNSTGSIISLQNLTPEGASIGARYRIADAEFLANGGGASIDSASVAVSNSLNKLDTLHIVSSYFVGNAGGAVIARDLDEFVLRDTSVNLHNLATSAAVALFQNGTSLHGSAIVESCTFSGNTNDDPSYMAQSAGLSLTGYETVHVIGSVFSSNYGNTAVGTALAVSSYPADDFDVLVPDGELRIESSEFTDNSVGDGEGGGAVGMSNILSMQVLDSRFERNYGSAINGQNTYFNPDDYDAVFSTLFLANSSFIDNVGGLNDGGGGVNVNQMADVTVQDCLFLNQTGTGSGAALFLSNGLGGSDVGSFSVHRSRFERNRITQGFLFGGGAVMLLSVADITIDQGSVFLENSANGTSGGAIAQFTGGLVNDTITLTISESSFVNNSVTNVFGEEIGGAVLATVGLLRIHESEFLYNYGGQYGGAVDVYLMENIGPDAEGQQRVMIEGNLFKGNEATDDGGALFLSPLVLAQPTAGIADDNVFEGNQPNDINQSDIIS